MKHDALVRPQWQGRPRKPWRSLQTRLTLLVLGLVLGAVWTLAALGYRLLHADVERLVTDQQQASLAVFADELNQALTERLSALEGVSRRIRATMLDDPRALQNYLLERPTFQALFSAGFFSTDSEGIVTASMPLTANRQGAHLQAPPLMRQALQEGRSVVGPPQVGPSHGGPVLAMATPIRDSEGRVVGSLVGVTDLGQPGFLDRVARGRYGKTGGHLLVALPERVIVMASDRTQVLQPLASPGVDPGLDRLLSGESRSLLRRNAQGEEELTAAQAIPSARWVLMSQLPVAEAYLPVHNLLHNVGVAAAMVSLLAVLLSAWVIRRQLAPMREAATALALQSQADRAPEPLPEHGPDELGELISGFNRLVATLGERERALRDSEFRWKFAIEGAGDGLWDWDLPAHRTYYSRAWKSMLGCDDAEIGNDPQEWAARVHPEDRAAAEAALDDHLQGRSEVYAHEHRLRCQDGRYKWILGRGVVVARGAQGEPLRVLGTHTDITARRAAADALQQSHELLMRVINAVPARVFWKDTDLRYLGCNAAFAGDAGADSPAAVIGKRDHELSWAAQAEQYNADDRAVMRTGRAKLQYLEPQQTPDGRTFWLRTTKVPLRNPEGEVIGVLGVYEDFTERRGVEAQLRKLSLAVEQSSESIVITDLQGRIEYVNEAFVLSSGYTREEAIGSNSRMLRSGQTPPETYVQLWQTLLQGQRWRGEFINRHRDGHHYTEHGHDHALCASPTVTSATTWP